MVQLAATYFGYQVYKSASDGDSGYEQINSGPSQSNLTVQQPQQNPFVPASYTAPSTQEANVVRTVPTQP